MERIITTHRTGNDAAAISFEQASAEFEKDVREVEAVSCKQQLKNLLKTNLKLLKLNDIGSILLF
jgi:hypothetical protein